MKEAAALASIGVAAVALLRSRLQLPDDPPRSPLGLTIETEPPADISSMRAAMSYAAALLPSSTRVSTRFEFGPWAALMSAELVEKLDRFADRVAVEGGRVQLSPDPGALGRRSGFSDTSQHNVDRWGEVRAADVMVEGITLKRAVEVARLVGFQGIGAYPDWLPLPGLHLDVRADRTGSNPATWAGRTIDGRQYTNLAIDQAWT